MTNEEFLAWFDGFTRQIRARPTRQQWAQIVETVAKIAGGSPVKAWFEGRTASIKGAPSEKEWREIKAHMDAERTSADTKKKGLSDVFQSFEKKAERLRDAPGSKARKPAK